MVRASTLWAVNVALGATPRVVRVRGECHNRHTRWAASMMPARFATSPIASLAEVPVTPAAVSAPA
jgi:hypothetical protein